MEAHEIKKNLCIYDERNPYFCFDEEEVQDHNDAVKLNGRCFCDNCFYGRTILANELLKYMKI